MWAWTQCSDVMLTTHEQGHDAPCSQGTTGHCCAKHLGCELGEPGPCRQLLYVLHLHKVPQYE